MRPLILLLLMATGLGAQVIHHPLLNPSVVQPQAPTFTAPVTKIILFCPAERVTEGKPARLTEQGEGRAQFWRLVLSLYEPTALVTTGEPVSEATLAPTGKHLSLQPRAFSPKDPKALAREILSNHKGGSVVVCWPPEQLKPLALALGVPEPLAEWPEEIYDQLWVIRLGAKGEGAIDTGLQGAPPDALAPTGYAVMWGIER